MPLATSSPVHLGADPSIHLSVVGPIVGGFVAENPRLGWHFNFWLMFLFSMASLIGGYFFTPETVSYRLVTGRLFSCYLYLPLLPHGLWHG